TAALFMGFFASLYPLFTVKVLGLTPAAIGLVVATGGAFALAGAAVSEKLVRRLGFGRAFLVAVLFSNATTFLHPMAHGSVALCIGGAGYLVSTLWLVFSPIPHLRELPAATNAATSAVT